MSPVRLTECPRDAMQGLHSFIPTSIKATYINLLLQCGFNTIDFGSFVSPKAIPQTQDTAAVLDKLDIGSSQSKLLVIVANYRGAVEAAKYEAISYFGFPFSISETFQQRNTNSGIAQSFNVVQNIHELCIKNNKKLRIYLSMGFGNPYGDEWSTELLLKWADIMLAAGINDIYVADTIGIATPHHIGEVFKSLNSTADAQFGVHLHSTPDNWFEKIDAAWESGCRKFDTTLKGYGGCPMAKDDLTGNIATENLLGYLADKQISTGIDMERYADAMAYSGKIFN